MMTPRVGLFGVPGLLDHPTVHLEAAAAVTPDPSGSVEGDFHTCSADGSSDMG